MSLWRLRLTHQGGSSILVEHGGAPLIFDPLALPPGATALVTWQDVGRMEGVLRAVKAGASPPVVAGPEVLDWLGTRGSILALPAPQIVEGVRVEAEPYTPIPWATPAEAGRKLVAALKKPLTATARVAARVGRPPGPPYAYTLTFPDGSRLLHLGCALHKDTDRAWLTAFQERHRGVDWLMVGVDYEDEEAVLDLLPPFQPKLALITDLINAERRAVGLPTRLLTPTVDRLIDRGIPATPFAPGSTYRFS